MKSGGVALVADVVVPVSVIGSTIPYPSWDEIKGIVAPYTDKTYLVPATRIGLEVGNPRAFNMVMLGSLSVFLELEAAAWTENICYRLPPNFVESSIEAFLRDAEENKAMIQAKETVK